MDKKSIALLKAILVSARPNTWLRVWGEMLIGAAAAHPLNFRLEPFFLAFIATSPLLWTGAYMLNDVTDTDLDHQHPVRSRRPIAHGEIDKRTALIAIATLTALSLLLARLVDTRLIMILMLLALSQISYTVKPLRFKERPILDIAVNGFNSVLRFFAGWVSQTATAPIPFVLIIMLASIKLVLFLGHRAQNRTLERANHIHSTTTLLSPRLFSLVSAGLVILSVLCFFAAIFEGVLPITSLLSGVGLLPLVRYMSTKKNIAVLAQEKDMGFRNALYGSYFLWSTIIAIGLLWQPV